MINFPRLSSTLRSNSDLDINIAKECAIAERPTLIHFQNGQDSPAYRSLLKNLRTVVSDCMGPEEVSGVIDSVIMYIIRLFIFDSTSRRKNVEEIKSKFGTLFARSEHQIIKIAEELASLISDTHKKRLEQYSHISPGKSVRKCWGTEILIVLPTSMYNNISQLQSMSAKQEVKKRKPKSCTIEDNLQSFDLNIYQLLECLDTSHLNRMVHVLKSKQNVTDIRNELCEIIGFNDDFMLSYIVSNQESVLEIVNNILNSANSSKKLLNQERIFKPRPTVATSIVVQSQLEKDLSRQSRRNDKKIGRLLKCDSLSKSNSYLNQTLNPMVLRSQQQKKLIENIKQQPVLHTTKVAKINYHVMPQYPYVFDSPSIAKGHASFIGGNKISLPESAERINTKQYEEVKIFAPPPPDLTVGQNRIKIQDLDSVGKIVFRDIEMLNRIQSVVFSAAYHSNNNLLICAPTGAGKTNVAMLAIVATIRSHIENGVIDLDAFKVVYIAPMKALAAEMVDSFSKRLKPLKINVRELTGDMQLTKTEMQKTQILVTTPEKWDVVTRKGGGDVSILNIVKLLIIDEVHLLHGERGPVIEALVARTLRLVESLQSMIRIVGLSATLPNYIDVAHFLRVNPMKGLFYFDSRFRPVPLDTHFIGTKTTKPIQTLTEMDSICYTKCLEMVRKNHQVMVFVHARNATTRTASMLRESASQKNQSEHFLPQNTAEYKLAIRNILKSKNKQLIEFFQCGIAFHHAGMLRTDRRLVEKYFAEGYVKVLICTATLAWGVNLPAHAVIIKGTDIYDSARGSFVDLGILDVLQIFGRAGRPQYDNSGVGVIITTHEKLNHYLSLLTNQFPIESNFIECLSDNLNAEIASGTVTNVDEAIEWLSFTYLFVRMRLNPQHYGIEYSEIQGDPLLQSRRRVLITAAAMNLDKAKMIRFNHKTNDFSITELGRTASHFYIKYHTVEIFNELLKQFMTEGEIFNMISHAQEFQQLKVRDDELEELDDLRHIYCKIPCHGGTENVSTKVNILLQTYLSRGFIKSFSLISDMSYIVQNVVRIARAVFTIVLRNNNAILASKLLQISQMFEKQIWSSETPLRQFTSLNNETIDKVESRGLSIYTLREMSFYEVKEIIRNEKNASLVIQCAHELPFIELDVLLQPITRTVLRVRMEVMANFKWNDRVHGKSNVNFWLWIEDPETNFIYHSELVQIAKKNVQNGLSQILVWTIPLREPIPPQYFIRITGDTWMGSKDLHPVSFKYLVLPEQNPPLTELLPLQPLSVHALQNCKYEALYPFSYFNPIQTQIFHNLYHSDNNILLCAPTGSGKTIVAEIAIFRTFETQKRAKVVYIAPLKALVKERINDWSVRFERSLKKNVIELTGDTSPDILAIKRSQVIVTTPEKWDSISRSWQTREYVKDVALIIIDEIHLLGEERGSVIEVIVSRTNFITSFTKKSIRIIGLSTALANAQDLANWLRIKKNCLYNFKPSVRPVPLQVHINGFSGKHYCPRMATMNRPTYQAIRTYAPASPAIVFVSSRRQTRLTALDLITIVAGEENPKQFLHVSDSELQKILLNVKDGNVKFCLSFGIGLHHAALSENDKKIVENLFLNKKIQILIATATLAWGINMPARLVVIKGTEYFDSKVKKYVDMSVIDVLQMMGRAGRPQFDSEGVAVIFVHDVKKNFYKRFLYDPFPVESSLSNVLPDHINAEIVSGTVQTKCAAVDYLSWTFFFRRLLQNPTYYNLKTIDPHDVNLFLSALMEDVINCLKEAACVIVTKDFLVPTLLGRIASFYYLSYHTMKHFLNDISYDMDTRDLLLVISGSFEFEKLPVRHNEDASNEELAKSCRFKSNSSYDSPFTKTFLLLQAHIGRLSLPNTDYLSDTKSVLDQVERVIQAMMDYSAERGWLHVTLRLQMLSQSIIQACWFDEPVLLTLPHVVESKLNNFYQISSSLQINHQEITLPFLKEICSNKSISDQLSSLRECFVEKEIENISKVIKDLPDLTVTIHLQKSFEDSFSLLNVNSCEWIDVKANESHVVCVDIFRTASFDNSFVYCPKYFKLKHEGWFLVLGCQSNNSLLALKRVVVRNKRSTHRLCFKTPPNRGRLLVSVYLMSDCYIGLDQQFNLQLNVV